MLEWSPPKAGFLFCSILYVMLRNFLHSFKSYLLSAYYYVTGSVLVVADKTGN